MSGSNETIVTEIIVDSRGAVKGTEDYEIALRALNRTAEATATTLARRKAAEEEAARTGASVADILVATGRGYTAAAKAADTYLGRLDPIIFAQNALAKETANVEMAQLGLDKQRLAGKITVDQLATGTLLLKGRLAELATTSAQVGDRTITVADAMNVLKTESERTAASIGKVTSGMADYVARAADVEAANRRMITSQQAYNQIAFGPVSQARTSPAQAISNPLYGEAALAREAALTVAIADEYNNTRAALIPLEAEIQKYQAQLAAVADAQAKGIISSTEAAQAIDRIYASTSVAVKGLRDFEAVAADVDAATRKMTLSQQAYNQMVGEGLVGVARSSGTTGGFGTGTAISNPLYGEEALKRQADLVAALGTEYDQLRSKIDPVYRLSKQYEAALEEINAIQGKVGLSAKQIEDAQEAARLVFVGQVDALNKTGKAHEDLDDKVKKGTVSAGQMKFANQQLTVQMSQMISGIATGQPILITLIQQGHQIADVMWASGISFKEMAASAASMGAKLISAVLSPIGLVVTGVVAVIGTLAAFTLSAQHHQQDLLDIQEHLRATQDSYKALGQTVIEVGRQVAGTSTLSRTDATAAANTFASSSRFAGSKQDLADLVRIAEDAARVLGVTVPEAAKKLTEAMAGPSAVVQEFADKGLLGFNQKMADSIDLMERTNGKAAAYQAMMKQILTATKGAAEEGLTPLGKAWNNFLNSFSKFGDAAKPFTDTIGTAILDLLSKLVDALTAIVTNIQKIIDLIPKIPAPPDWLKSFLSGPIFSLSALGNLMAGGGPAGPTQAPASIAPALLSSAALNNLDPELLTRLQAAEGVFKNGQWQTGSTGAVGPMQVLPSTFAGMLRQPGNYPGAQGLTDLSNPTQNVAAGAAYFAYLLHKYTDVTLAVLAYHEGETKMDAILAGRAQASQEGLDEARKVLAGYKGSGQVTPTASTSTTIPDVLVTAPKDTQADINDAQKLANSVDAFKRAHDETLKLQHAFDLLKSSGQGTTEQFNALTLAIEASRKAEYDAVGPVAAAVREHDLQTDMLKKVGEAYLVSYDAVQKATIATQAYAEATKLVAPGTSEHAAAVVLLTDAITKQTQATIDNATAAKNLDTQQQIEFIKVETATLTDNVEVRARELAVYKQRQELQKSGANLDSAASRQALAYAAALADANTQLQINSQALQELGNLGTQVFDQVGNAITQAFVGGQGAAVNFGNVARAVLTSVLQEVLKLAILNPILNSVVGGANRTTLDQVIGAVGGGGSSSGGGISQLKDVASTGSSVLSGGSSILQALGYQGLGGQVNSLLGGPGGSLFGGTGISEFFGGGAALQGPTLSGAALNSTVGLSGFLNTGIGTSLGSSATIGTALGGIGGGFALGSLSGSLIQGSMDKVGPAPMIGAGVGAIAGAAIGSFIPVVGTVLGGIIGGFLGGSGGGFIGPHAPSTYSGTQIFVDDSGRLTVGQSSNQGTVSNRNATNDAVTALNDFTSATNLAVTSLGGLTQLGVGTGDDKAANLDAAFSRLRFTSTDPRLNASISDRSFGSFQELQDAVTRIQQMNAAITDFSTVLANTDAAGRVDEWVNRFDTLTVSAADFTATLTDIANFVTQVVPPLLAANDNIGSFATQLKALNDQFNPAIARAHDLGYKEAELTAARDKSIQTLEDAVNRQYSDMATSLINRAADAANKFFGASNDVLKEQALKEFDEAAGKQRDDLATQLKGIFGDDYATTQAFADEIGRLDTALYFERLNAAKQFDVDLAAQDKAAADARLQAAGTAAQAITSLAQYAISLQTSASSPLSPQDQYALAQRQFSAVSGAAAAGDYNSITQLQGYAQTFIDASRAVYGSGASYVADFQRVLDALGAVATIAPDTLTASVMQSEMRTQTAELVDVLDQLKAAVDGVTSQLRQNQQAPDRLAG